MRDSIANATPPKSTESRHWDFSVLIQIGHNSNLNLCGMTKVIWQIPQKILHPRNPSHPKTQISRYLVVQIQSGMLVWCQFVPRNLRFAIWGILVAYYFQWNLSHHGCIMWHITDLFGGCVCTQICYVVVLCTRRCVMWLSCAQICANETQMCCVVVTCTPYYHKNVFCGCYMHTSGICYAQHTWRMCYVINKYVM